MAYGYGPARPWLLQGYMLMSCVNGPLVLSLFLYSPGVSVATSLSSLSCYSCIYFLLVVRCYLRPASCGLLLFYTTRVIVSTEMQQAVFTDGRVDGVPAKLLVDTESPVTIQFTIAFGSADKAAWDARGTHNSLRGTPVVTASGEPLYMARPGCTGHPGIASLRRSFLQICEPDCLLGADGGCPQTFGSYYCIMWNWLQPEQRMGCTVWFLHNRTILLIFWCSILMIVSCTSQCDLIIVMCNFCWLLKQVNFVFITTILIS